MTSWVLVALLAAAGWESVLLPPTACCQEAALSLSDLSPLDDTHWWMTYNYKNPRIEPLIPALRQLVDSGELTPGDPETAPRVQYFAALLQGKPEQIEKVRALRGSREGGAYDQLGEIVARAEHYAAVSPGTKADLDLLWAEYRALGNQESVGKIFGLLLAPESAVSERLRDHAVVSLVANVPRHPEVRAQMAMVYQSAKIDAGSRFGTVVKALDATREKAKNLRQRGQNLIRNGEHSEGIALLKDAAKICQDHEVYNAAASYYLRIEMAERAVPFLMRAIDLEPRDFWPLMQLGYFHYQRQEYDQAIDILERAVAENQKASPALYNLVCAYCESGDHSRALELAVKYLDGNPKPEAAENMRNYLAKFGIKIQEAAPDPPAMLRAKNYAQLEEHFAQLLEAQGKDEDGRGLLFRAYKRVTSILPASKGQEDLLAELQAWLAARPESHFANACLGIFYKDYAWDARGTGWASTVGEEGWKRFAERLGKAEEILETAYRLDPSDPVVPAEIVAVTMGKGGDRERAEVHFQRAVKADPSEFTAYETMLAFLSPKWHGSIEEMLAFARHHAEHAPPDSAAPRLVAKAHWDMYIITKNRDYFKDPAVWREVRESYKKTIERFPKSLESRNWLARSAFMAGDLAVAREQFEIIGDEGSTEVWGSQKSYQETREYMMSVEAPR